MMLRNANNLSPSHRYNNVPDNFISIRRRAKQLKQIQSHHQKTLKNRDPAFSDVRIPNLPLLGYYVPESRAEYAPRSSLESSRLSRKSRAKETREGTKGGDGKESRMDSRLESRDLGDDELGERREAYSQMLPQSISAVVDAVVSFDNAAYPVFSPYSPYPHLATLDHHRRSIERPVDPYYQMALSRLRRDRDKTHNVAQSLTPRSKKESLGLSPITGIKKQLNKKYNYVDLEQLEKEQCMFYQLAQQKLKEFREKAEAISPSRKKRENLSPSPSPPMPIKESPPKKQESPKMRASLHEVTKQWNKKEDQVKKLYGPRNTQAKRAFTPWRPDNDEDDLSNLVK